MNIRGRVCNGVVVFDNPSELPEGAIVNISYPVRPAESADPRQRVRLPLVPSEQPGSTQLMCERVAELLDDDEAQV